MKSSDTIGALAAALAKAQAEVKPALKDSKNPFFKTMYADFSSVLDACEDALSGNGLALIQAPVTNENGAGVVTLLCHDSGEWISEELILPVSKNDAQGVGSCITYARRYALEGFMRIRREDDDGNAAAAAAPERQVKPLSEEARKWIEWAGHRPTLEELNAEIGKLSQMASEYERRQVWQVISGYARSQGWEWEVAGRCFIPQKGEKVQKGKTKQ